MNTVVVPVLLNVSVMRVSVASGGNAFEILPDPQLEELATPTVTTFLVTRRRYERIIDECLSPAIEEETPLRTEIALHVLAVMCRHRVKVSEDDLADEALLAFLHGYGKPSLKEEDYDVTFLGAEIEHQMNLKLFDRIENLACQCENIIQTIGLQQVIETKAGKKKWRQVIISKIEPKLLSNRLGEALANSLNTDIRDDYVKSFDWLKERVFSNAREHKTDSIFHSPPRLFTSSKQMKGFNKKGQKGVNPPHLTPFFLERSKGIRCSRRIRARVMP
jgi:hypothetical protein